MRKVCIINGNKLYVDERCGNTVKVITPDYDTYKELNMGLGDNGWYEKWIDISDLGIIK